MLPVFSFILTAIVYWGAKRLYVRVPRAYLSPLIVTPALVILIVLWGEVPYADYNTGTKWLTEMIGPGTVTLAVPLYKNLGMLKKHAAAITAGVLSGAILAILTSILLAKAFHLTTSLTESLAPRSATTPIAMAAAGVIGGIPSMTAVFVLITGILGVAAGPLAIRLLRIEHEVGRGVLLGTSSHTAGTTKAFEFGSAAGSISSIAMIMTAFITFCAAPWILTALMR
ncbi:LrgB family protein [Paenibacillus humicola]|uniref:LrgB family protein n=1 Tax=Paenibacillus humicola TaxID=3110540 RepID=UPI00237B213F|nr:LrgB family protein [Paenibacillus humicola]